MVLSTYVCISSIEFLRVYLEPRDEEQEDEEKEGEEGRRSHRVRHSVTSFFGPLIFRFDGIENEGRTRHRTKEGHVTTHFHARKSQKSIE